MCGPLSLCVTARTSERVGGAHWRHLVCSPSASEVLAGVQTAVGVAPLGPLAVGCGLVGLVLRRSGHADAASGLCLTVVLVTASARAPGVAELPVGIPTSADVAAADLVSRGTYKEGLCRPWTDGINWAVICVAGRRCLPA